MSEQKPRARARRRAPIFLLRAAAVLLTFISSLVLAVLLHLDTPLVRLSAARALNLALADTFYGKLQVGRFTQLSANRIVAADITMFDADGEPVIEMSALQVELQTLDDIWDLLFGGERISIVLPHVRGERAIVSLRPGPDQSTPSIAHAFEPLPSRSRSKRPKREPRHVRLFLPHIELGQVETRFEYPSLRELAPVLSQARGSLLVSPRGVAVNVERVGLSEAEWSKEPVRGTSTMKLRVPGALNVGFNGFVGDAELLASVMLLEDNLTIEAAAPRLSPAAVQALVPEWPFKDNARAELSASGTLSKLAVDAELGIGPAEILAEGELTLAPELSTTLVAQVRHFDLRSLDPSLPTTSIDASGSLDFSLRDEQPRLTLKGHTDPTSIASVLVPAVEVDAVLSDNVFSGAARIFEPGSRIDGQFRLGEVTTAQAKTQPFRLEHQRRLPSGLRGLTTLSANTRLENGQLFTNARGGISGFSTGPLTADRVGFEARVVTPTSHPERSSIKAKIRTKGLQLDFISFEEAEFELDATAAGADVTARLSDTDGRSVRAEGRVSPSLSVHDATISIRRRQVHITAQLAELDVQKRRLNLQKLNIEGAGERFDGRVRLQPGLVEAELAGKRLKLGVLADALGLPSRSISGTLTVQANLTAGSDLRRGSIRAELEHGSFEGFGDSNVKLFASLDEKQVSGNLTAKDELGVQLGGSWEVELAGHPLAPEAWVDATGTAEWRLHGVPLAGGELLAPEQLSHLDGRVGARVLLERRAAGVWPTMFAETGVTQLELAIKTPEGELPLPSLSPYMSAVFDGAGKKVHASAVLNDEVGQLVTATGAVDFDPDRWLASPEEAWEHFQTTPLSISLSMPSRSVSQLPLIELDEELNGEVALQVAISQSLNAPRLSLVASGDNLIQTGSRQVAPMSLSVSADYAPLSGQLKAHVSGSSSGRSVVLGKFSGTVPNLTLSTNADWDAKAQISLNRFPLRVLAPLAAGGVDGHVSGWATLDTRAPVLEASLKLDQMRAGRAELGTGTLTLKGEPGEVLGRFALGRNRRTLDLAISATGSSERILMPHQVTEANVEVNSHNFNAAAFAPLLEPALGRVSGGLDANLTVSLKKRRAKLGQLPIWSSELRGEADLKRGSAYVDALGLELRDIGARLTFSPTGTRTRLRLKDLKAKARSERVNLRGNGQVLLSGLQVDSGSGTITLRQVPITLQGLNMGKATGRAETRFERRKNYDVPGPHQGKDYILVDTELSYFSLKAARTASRELIDLSDNNSIVVLQTEKAPESAPEVLPYRFIVRLKDKVDFSLAELNLPLTGETTTDLTDTTRVQGTILLSAGGRIPLLGKVLEVTGGRVTLNPDQPSNPAINITLSGRADSGDPVFVTVGGTLQDPVTDPPPAELQALLGGGAGSLLSGGVQALGVNELLGDSFAKVELRVSSTDQDGDARALAAQAQSDNQRSYSAARQIGEDLWLEVSYHQNNADQLFGASDEGSSTSASLDYRINNSWSLKTQLGTAGGSLDLLWEHRY